MTYQLSDHQKVVFEDRYALKDKEGKPVEKTLEEMWLRVADAIGETKDEANEFYSILNGFKFVPAGRILAGAGAGTEQTFYNCYVIPVEPKQSTLAATPNVGKDSREAIFDTIATMVDIMSRGGGVGINWSTLRPSGSYLSRVSGTSSGPVGWMDVASKAVGEVEQGGSRRGAAMFMLDDWHPDIMKFVEAKRDFAKITNANVSVAVSDDFIQRVNDDAEWSLRFPDTSDARYNSEWDGDLRGWESKGYPVRVYDTVPARRIWESLVASAHASGEPGLVFLDRYNQLSTGAHAERIISVNPCGEQGLGAYSVCNLGAMNLAAYVEGDKFNWDDFRSDVAVATRFLDNVIDKSFYWDDRSKKRQQDLRRIGLGVMGLADALVMLGVRYGSRDAVAFTETVFEMMKDTAISTSASLAYQKGPAKSYYNGVWGRPYLQEYGSRHNGDAWLKPLRNLFFLTQAPTGTTSLLAGVNSGIEPFFALKYTRKDRTGTHEVVPTAISNLDPSCNYPYVVTAGNVSVEEHIAMQAAVQKYVDSSVSKTINAPNEQNIEEVAKAYMMAYDAGLKGIAYFRDGSGRDQVLYNAKPEETKVQDLGPQLEAALARIAQLEEEAFVGPTSASEFSRPAKVAGETFRLNTSMGTMYLTLNRDDAGKPVEIFVNVGKAGSDVMAMGEAVGRLVSLGLQQGITLSKIAGQLVGVGGTAQFNPGLVHAIGKVLADAASEPQLPMATGSFENAEGRGEWKGRLSYEKADPRTTKTTSPAAVPLNKISGNLCPDCKNFSVAREEGCQKCYSCGWSAC